jgi:hypothetical protein
MPSAARPYHRADTGRLETGMRQSAGLMNKIARALESKPNCWFAARKRCTHCGVLLAKRRGPAAPRDDPASALGGETGLVALAIEHGAANMGDQLRLRQHGPEDYRACSTATCCPPPGGRFAFGRMIDRDEARVAVQLLAPARGKWWLSTRLDSRPKCCAQAVSKLRVLSIATLYPNDQTPNFGVFVERQMQAVAKRGDVDRFNPIAAALPAFAAPRYRGLGDLPQPRLRRSDRRPHSLPPKTGGASQRCRGALQGSSMPKPR